MHKLILLIECYILIARINLIQDELYVILLCLHKGLFTFTVPLAPFFIPTRQIQLSRGEICVANFIPPANGARQGNFLLAKM